MKRKSFNGWFIVAAGMAMMATSVGIVNNCFGLLVVPACTELGFSRQAMAGNQTMLSLGVLITALTGGKLFNRRNLVGYMRAGSLVMCALYFLFAVVKSLPLFYVVALATGIAQGTINFMAFTLLISAWFRENRGLAMGLTYMGSGLGGMLFNAIGGRLIENIGWRRTVVVYGIILCAVILPLVFFVIRMDPKAIEEEKEIKPAGKKGARTFLRVPAFYIIGLDIIVSGMAVNGIATTSTPYYTDVFSSGTIAANLASGFMASLAFGKFFLGVLYDKLGMIRSTLLTRALLIISLLSLMLGRHPAFVATFLLLVGLAAATSSISVPFFSRAVSTAETETEITGIYSALSSLGALCAPVFCGGFCDRTGSYAQAYLVMAVMVAVILAPVMLTLERLQKRQRGAPKQ